MMVNASYSRLEPLPNQHIYNLMLLRCIAHREGTNGVCFPDGICNGAALALPEPLQEWEGSAGFGFSKKKIKNRDFKVLGFGFPSTEIQALGI